MHFTIINEIEHLFICLLAIWIASFAYFVLSVF